MYPNLNNCVICKYKSVTNSYQVSQFTTTSSSYQVPQLVSCNLVGSASSDHVITFIIYLKKWKSGVKLIFNHLSLARGSKSKNQLNKLLNCHLTVT